MYLVIMDSTELVKAYKLRLLEDVELRPREERSDYARQTIAGQIGRLKTALTVFVFFDPTPRDHRYLLQTILAPRTYVTPLDVDGPHARLTKRFHALYVAYSVKFGYLTPPQELDQDAVAAIASGSAVGEIVCHAIRLQHALETLAKELIPTDTSFHDRWLDGAGWPVQVNNSETRECDQPLS